jgi:hypothetical protein
MRRRVGPEDVIEHIEAVRVPVCLRLLGAWKSCEPSARMR